jgi:serine protease AprX
MSHRMNDRSLWPRRVAGALVCLVFGSAFGLRGVQGAQGAHRAHLSTDLLVHEGRQTAARKRVILRGTPDEIEAIAERHHLSVIRLLDGDAAVLSVNSAELTDLASDGVVDHISPDARVQLMLTVSNVSTGATQVRTGTNGLLGLLGAYPAVTGKGIGVAVLDSGISPHAALKNVVANVNFVTGTTGTGDVFGHGTHVAGIVGGAPTSVTSQYAGGIAPGASIINVRVLGPDGTGSTSDVIAGMEWVIANRARYNIRVINLSLGHPVTEPSVTDPLCQEVAKATSLGLVVVAAAGNAGKTADGRTILGGIASPGNSPFAITVGALNTWQTTKRSDDSVTTYSSRGPTRYDLAVKPDLVAPGNKIVSLEAAGSYLATNYSWMHVAGSGTNAYARMSGTSMSTPMVSGAVALLLQGNSSLSPARVKLALQSGSTYLPADGLMAGGAGSANFWPTRQLTGATGLTALLQALLGGPSGASFWDAGTLTSRLYKGTGLRVLSLLDTLAALLNPSLLHWGDLNLVGPTNSLSTVPANSLIWGQVASWRNTTNTNVILWGDTVYDPSGNVILWGDSNTTDDYVILWGDSVVTDPDPQ